MKDKILQEFLNSDIEIISQEKLEKYIDFCLDNNQSKKTKFKTSHHHILPKAIDCFPEYGNLLIYSWNGVHLSKIDHYDAHSMIIEALNIKSQTFAFLRMKIKDKSGNDLRHTTSNQNFEEILEGYNKQHSEYMKSLNLSDKMHKEYTKDGKITTRAIENGKRMSKTMKNTIGVKDKNGNKFRIDKNDPKWLNGEVTHIRTGDKHTKKTISFLKTICVKCIDIDGNKLMVSKKEYNNRDDLTHVNSGIKRSDEYKKRAAENNYLIIKIFDNNDTLQFISTGHFKEFCKENNLPFDSLCKSYRTSGKVYENIPNNIKSVLTKNGNIKYQGWYAKVVEEDFPTL